MTPRLFADLHCHPTLYGFNRMRNHPDVEGNPHAFHPWNELPSNARSREAGVRATAYSQCDFPALAEGAVRLTFASFTPIEKGFFVGSTEGRDYAFGPELLRLMSGWTLARSAGDLLKSGTPAAAHRMSRILRNDGPLRMLIQRIFLKYGFKRIRHILSNEYDYWEEFMLEYNFLRSQDGVRHPAGCYQLIKSCDQLERLIDDETRDEIAVLLSIEGAHVFSIGPDQKPVAPSVMFERIRTLKMLTHPILFITLAHHFDNGLCGHAHSLVDSGGLVMDQRTRMDGDFEEIGLQVVRSLLDLDDDLKDCGGRRILIDVKHMSPKARRTYYDEIVRPYNTGRAKLSAAHQRDYPKLPVLFSHAGYAGVATLDEFIDDAHRENDHWHRNPYYAWGINLCDEDVRMAHDTQGLIGICFDQRIAGVPPGQKVPSEGWAHILLNQILGLVDVIMQDDRLDAAQKRSIWDVVCLGSDYDGVIDPVSAYPTARSLKGFAQDLARLLRQQEHTRMIAEIGVDELVEKISWKNAYDFTRRHLPSALGHSVLAASHQGPENDLKPLKEPAM